MYKIIDEKVIDVSSIGDVLQVDTLTFPAKAGVTTGDYINIYDKAGVHYAIYLDLTGADSAPTGANYVAADYSSSADISASTTAIDVAAVVELALNALTGFTAAITTDDTAADGTMTLTQVVAGVATNPIPNNEDDTGVGSITTAATTEGNDQADISSDTIDIRYIYGYSAMIKWASSTCTAAIKLQESNDNVNWVDVASGSQAISNNSGTSILNFADRMSGYLRVTISYTSGILTTATVDVFAKG